MTTPYRSLPLLLASLLIALMATFFSTGSTLAQKLLVKDGQTIAFLGDSITAGGAKPGGDITLVVKGLEANGVKITALNARVIRVESGPDQQSPRGLARSPRHLHGEGQADTKAIQPSPRYGRILGYEPSVARRLRKRTDLEAAAVDA